MTDRKLNFSLYKQRHVAFKIAYFGWNYAGFAYQQSTENTVEGKIIDALIKTRLIESLETCNLVRCGRTDKGVSSYGQVINLNVRSKLSDEARPENVGLFTPDNYTGPYQNNIPKPSKGEEELDYVKILNRVLPDDIRVLAWSPVAIIFSSRFNCKQRSYSYIFPIGNLCVESMAAALRYLVGERDFRNLCTLDLENNVTEHRRTIISATIEAIESPTELAILGGFPEYCYYRIKIVGKAFLYHQIRCIMTIIFLVGSRNEEPTLVKDLLDVENCTRKPMFNHASPLPLSLYTCDFGSSDLPQGWIYEPQALQAVRKHLKSFWFEHKTKTVMIEDLLSNVESEIRKQSDNQGNGMLTTDWRDFNLSSDNRNIKNYVQILKRKREESLKDRLEMMRAKKSSKELKKVD